MKNERISLTIKVLVLLLISILSSLCIERLVFDDNIYSETRNVRKSTPLSYPTNEFISQGYNKVGESYTVETDDPWFLKEGINKYISSISIDFNNSIDRDMLIKVYYTINDEDFSEEQTVSSIINQGSKEIQLNIGKQINKIRIDIGNKVNEKFELSRIDFNSGSSMIAWYAFRVILMAILLASIVLYWFIVGKKANLERTFIIFGSLFGILFMLIMPINQIPDEHGHFQTAYKLSNKILFIDDKDKNKTYMRKCDDVFNSVGIESNKSLYDKSINMLKSPYDTTLIQVDIRNMNNFFVLYLPSAIMISIARLLNLNPMILYMLGRLVNLSIFVFLAHIGLKKIPISRSSFFVVLMIPMVLHEAASYAADSILNSICFAFIGYSFYALYAEKINYKDVIMLTILATLLAPSKTTYFPIIFISLFVIKSKYKNSKNHKFILGVFMLSIISAFLFQNLGFFTGNPLNGANILDGKTILYDGTQGYSKSFILENPIRVMHILLDTLRICGSSYLRTLFGSSLGWLNIPVSVILIDLFILLFIFACLNNKDTNNSQLNIKKKSVVFIIVCMVTVLVEIALFLIWTHMGSNVVEGIQGRYFIPILPLVMLLIRNENLQFKKDITRHIIYSSIAIDSLIILTLFNFIISK